MLPEPGIRGSKNLGDAAIVAVAKCGNFSREASRRGQIQTRRIVVHGVGAASIAAVGGRTSGLRLLVKAYHAIRMHGSQFSPCSARQRHWKIGSLLIAYFAETCRRADARR
jgi:hypothetical protein